MARRRQVLCRGSVFRPVSLQVGVHHEGCGARCAEGLPECRCLVRADAGAGCGDEDDGGSRRGFEESQFSGEEVRVLCLVGVDVATMDVRTAAVAPKSFSVSLDLARSCMANGAYSG